MNYFIVFFFFIIFTETEMDGVSQWKAIRTDSESNRTWLVYNLDESRTPVTGAMAIRLVLY